MSFRKPFQRSGRTNSSLRRKSRGLFQNIIPAHVESLEERTLLSATVPGLNDHGLVINNSNAVGQTSLSVTSSDNARMSNNANGSGLYMTLDNNTGQIDTLRTIRITGVAIQNNGNAGAQIHLTNITLDSLIIDQALMRSNGGSGLYLKLTNATIGNLTIIDSSNPVAHTTANNGNSSYSGNQFDGVHIDGVNTTVGLFNMTSNVFNGNAGNGAYTTFERSTINRLVLNDNEAGGNRAGSGIQFRTNRTNIGIGASQITNNTLVNNSGAGLYFRATSLLQDSTPTGVLSNIDIGSISNNLFASNANAGMSVELGEQSTFDALLTKNTFNNNSMHGLAVRGTDAFGAFSVQVGTRAQTPTGIYSDANNFDNNAGSAILFELSDLSGNLGNTTAGFNVFGNQIRNTRAIAGSNLYRGEGVNVRIRGDVSRPNGAAAIAGATLDRNTIAGNAGDGIRFTVTEDSELTNVTIGNNTGANQTFDVNGSSAGGGSIPSVLGDGNTINNNGGNGVSIIRQSSAFVRGIKLLDNTITRNGEGVYVQASNTYETVPTAARPNVKVVTEIEIDRNTIAMNRINGLHFRTEFDAVLLVNMRYNRIDGNTANGILSTAVENNFSDFENLGGRWIKNAITSNGLNGVKLEAVTGTVNPLIIGQDGVDVFDNQSLGNYIAQNGEDGIDVQNFAGANNTVVPTDFRNDVDIINNQIIGNGQDGGTNPYTAGKGIDIALTGHNRRFRIDRNVIENNIGDGIEVVNSFGELGIVAYGNTIQSNGGRGVDILSQANGVLDVMSHIRMGGAGALANRVFNNGLEGVYIVATADGAETQDVNAETLLLSGGDRRAIVDTVLNIDNNEIRDNGNGVPILGTPPSTFSGGGLIIRVGANYSGQSFTEVADITGEVVGTGAGVGTNAAGFGNGRTNARIVNNDFSGNGGDDVTFETFNSTVTPPTTPGTWNATEFKDINADYDRDPLARFNVVFFGNTGESIDLTRGPNSTDGNSAGVIYNNAEAEFKSRNFKTSPNPSGPFNSASRPRIGTRVADRPSTSGGLGDAFGDFSGDSSNSSPNSGPNVSTLTGGGTVTSTAAATTAGGYTGPAPIRATLELPSGSLQTGSMISISGTGTNANGTHVVRVISITGTTYVVDLFVPTVTGDYSGNNYAGGGIPTAFNSAAAGGSFVIHNPSSFKFDGIGPSTLRVESNWDTSGFIQGGTNFNTGIGIGGSEISVSDIAWDEVATGTFSFLTVSVSDVTIPETAGSATVTVTLSEPAPVGGVWVSYTTSNGDAIAGSDYTPVSGSLFFAEGVTSLTETITINSDGIFEGTESFYFDLVNVSSGETGLQNGEILDRRGVITIAEPPRLSISNAQITEGDNGTKNIAFSITLAEGQGTPITVNYSTANGTAAAGSDFEATSGSVTFAPGDTVKTILIPVIGDITREATENFTVVLSSPSGGAQLDKATGVATITDNDTPTVSIGDAEVQETNGNQVIQFTVSLSKAINNQVTVKYATGNQSATAGQDYEQRNGQIVFNPGETTKTVSIVVLGDQTPENPETFTVTLSDPANSILGRTVGIGTINDDDTPIITVNDINVTEGDDNSGFAVFTVRMNRAVNVPVTVDFETTNGTATDADDYFDTSGTLTFAAGETSKTVAVQLRGNRRIEPTEQFALVLSNPTRSKIGDNSGNATIADNDVPNITIDDIGIQEDDGVAIFTVRLSKAIEGNEVHVDFATRSGTASAGLDYGSTSGTLIFAPGESVKQIAVSIVNSTFGTEGNEYFFVDLNSSINGRITKATGKGLIVDNSSAVGLVIGARPGFDSFVRIYDTDASTVRRQFYAYGSVYRGGVKIAVGDVDGNGITDVVTAPGTTGFGALIRVWDAASGAFRYEFNAFPEYRDGDFNIAAGDVNRDGYDDIVVSVASNGPPVVKIFDGRSGVLINRFYAYGANYRHGVRIAMGDVDGNGTAEIITVPGGTGYADVRVFHGVRAVVMKQFLAFPKKLSTASYNVAAGDLTGDGRDDIIVSVASNAGPLVRAFNSANTGLISAFYAYGTGFRGGVSVGAGDYDLDGVAEIITAPFNNGNATAEFRRLNGAIIVQTTKAYNGATGLYVTGQSYENDFLQLAGGVKANSNAASLQVGQAQALVVAAAEKFRAAGFSDSIVDKLANTTVSVADLAGGTLGLARPGAIILDVNAGGWGWFIDETPLQDEEFVRTQSGQYCATAPAAQGKVDLLTVLTHELAHQLGFDDLSPSVAANSLMTAKLTAGTRRATDEHLQSLFADSQLMDDLLSV